MNQSEYKKGIVYTLLCYIMWGNFPLYWYSLRMMSSTQLMSERIVWSVIFVVLITTLLKEWRGVLAVLTERKLVLMLFITSQLLFFNWLSYLWAITHDRVIDASLGYFITPIFSILLGRMILKERLSRAHFFAIVIAIMGIVWITIESRTVPFVALILASSFGFYGLLKKKYPVRALTGIAFETFFMLPFAVSYLSYSMITDHIVFFELSALPMTLLILSGAVTTIPLLLFAEGAKKIPLSLVGIVQFASPTLQLINGLIFFGESMSRMRLIGFMIVWVAVGIFIVSEYQRYQAQQRLLKAV
ncbi:EamA family transporter RarD [Wohlfahrtiimonas chitiniclastica]|uniref:EamA family transporter RarD n=1 Tax=Wohlfahrtiimonas chitiniclastica TaxID=400946 RepID=UPI0031BA0C7F